jgi:hypothetical protein
MCSEAKKRFTDELSIPNAIVYISYNQIVEYLDIAVFAVKDTPNTFDKAIVDEDDDVESVGSDI